MNETRRITLATAAADRLAGVARALDTIGPDGTTVIGRMRDAQGMLRAQTYEAPTRRGQSGGSAPAGVFASDRARYDEHDLDEALAGIARHVNRAVDIVNAYPPPHPATAAERRALGLADGPWCTSCARVEGADGAPRREPAVVGSGGELLIDRAGNVVDANLCRWCRGVLADWGRTPTPDEAARHARGQRVAWPADVPRPA